MCCPQNPIMVRLPVKWNRSTTSSNPHITRFPLAPLLSSFITSSSTLTDLCLPSNVYIPYTCLYTLNRRKEGISQSQRESDNFISSDQVQSHTRSKKPKRSLAQGSPFIARGTRRRFSIWSGLTNWILRWYFKHSRGLIWSVKPLLTWPLTLFVSLYHLKDMTQIKWKTFERHTCFCVHLSSLVSIILVFSFHPDFCFNFRSPGSTSWNATNKPPSLPVSLNTLLQQDTFLLSFSSFPLSLLFYCH